MDRTNCFANIADINECFALTEKKCEGCKFYKPSDNPELARARIISDVHAYSKKYNSK